MRHGALTGVLLLASLATPLPGTAFSQPTDDDRIALPAPVQDGAVSLEAAIAGRRSVREFDATPLTWEQVGQLAWAAQGITDPEKGLRAAPSAGALYPLELYFVMPGGTYHYVPAGHAMDRLSAQDLRPALQAAAGGQQAIAQAPLTIVITAVFARTAERFGERGPRYVYMEVGHAAQNIHLQAVALGLGSVPIGGAAEAPVREALSLPEDHEPLYIIPVGHPAPG